MERVNFTEGYLFDFYTPEMQQDLKKFEEPKNDNEKLINLQYDFMTTGSKEAWDALFNYSFFVCRKFVRDIFKKRKLYHTRNDIDDKAMEAVEYVLVRFKKSPAYFCKKNFSSELYLGCIHAFDYEYQTLNGRLLAMAKKICIKNNVDFDLALIYAKRKINKEIKQKKMGGKQNEDQSV